MAALSDGLGTKVFIGPVATSDDTSTYSVLTGWVEIAEVESIGEFGDSASAITFTSLSAARVRKRKGARDAGDVAIVCANVPGDLGQEAAIAAEGTKFRYAFKVVAADAESEDFTDSEFYFGALVMSKRVNVGASNAVNKRTINLAIDTDIHEVPSEDATP